MAMALWMSGRRTCILQACDCDEDRSRAKRKGEKKINTQFIIIVLEAKKKKVG